MHDLVSLWPLRAIRQTADLCVTQSSGHFPGYQVLASQGSGFNSVSYKPYQTFTIMISTATRLAVSVRD